MGFRGKGSSGRKRGRRICTRGGGRKRRKRHHERRSTLARPRAGSLDVSERLVERLLPVQKPATGEARAEAHRANVSKKTPSNSSRLVWSKPSDQAIHSSPAISPDMEQVCCSDFFVTKSTAFERGPTKHKVATDIVAVSNTLTKESRRLGEVWPSCA